MAMIAAPEVSGFAASTIIGVAEFADRFPSYGEAPSETVRRTPPHHFCRPERLYTLYTPAENLSQWSQARRNRVSGAPPAALERGRGTEAAQLLAPLLRSGTLSREDELSVRTALEEAWLLQDDLTQAAAALGRTPDSMREPIADARLSTLWRLHGRITFARGERSRAIALHARALKDAELAHDSRAIGLAHYELVAVENWFEELRRRVPRN